MQPSPQRMLSQFDDIEVSSMASSSTSHHEGFASRLHSNKIGDYAPPREGAFGKMKEGSLPLSAYKIKKMRAKAFHDMNEGFRQQASLNNFIKDKVLQKDSNMSEYQLKHISARCAFGVPVAQPSPSKTE